MSDLNLKNQQNLMNHLNPKYLMFLKFLMSDLNLKNQQNLMNHLNPKYLMFLKFLMFG